ncbi:MAG: hypothetical protein JOZ69_22295 [Myxococcales bacterium]|nr:hypothetical protein [Myxococcales bacterium]
MKKLSSERPYFRARLDYDSRLLVQFVRCGAERACLALEVIEKHAYDRSRFLRGARVDEGRIEEAGPEAAGDLRDADTTALRYLGPNRVDFQLLDKPICFDDRQEELYRLPAPIILVGCAGSGKTALTLTRLRTMRGEVLYVTHSAFLAETAASLYFSHGYENAEQNVDFLSLRKLLESIAMPAGRAVSAKDFQAFFERHRQACGFTSAHMLFEELRGVLAAAADGPLTREAYLALGVRQSMYAPAQRALVHDLFGKYRAWLGQAGLYDPSLLAHEYRPRAERRYDAVVVDEIQDLTNAELSLILATLKEPRGFLLCGDANQIVHPNFFSWSRVKSLFYSSEREALDAPVHVLDANYRSSRTVSELANRLLKVKNARFGSIDKESTSLVRPVGELEGRVAGLVKKDDVCRNLDRVARGSARVAVIVFSDEQKAEARRRFSTPLVFSVLEAKGLEYGAVILYDLVSTERAAFREIAAGVTQADVEGELSFARARDKSDKSLEAYKFFVNALYVAITRAIETVYLVETDAGHPLLGLLRVTFSEDVSAFTAKASTLEEWQREARRLELQGKDEQAEAIRRTILRSEPVPWPVLYGAGYDDVLRKALAPQSVFSKAKQQLYELGAFHVLGPLSRAVELRAGYRPVRTFDATADHLRERLLGPYRPRKGDPGRIFADVDRYGPEHRNMMSLTPLMCAAAVGNVALAERLVERGCRVDSVDVFGRMPLHFALRGAFGSATFATDHLGALYEILCPTGLDLEAEGRLLRLSRHQGEFFVLSAMIALFHSLYDRYGQRRGGFGAAMLEEAVLSAFPRSVLPEERRKRTYWNGVLARAEESSTYRPARRLWKRERLGHYVPSAATRLRTVDDRGVERFESLSELLRIATLDTLCTSSQAAPEATTPVPPASGERRSSSPSGSGASKRTG